jgi:cytochrome c-type biogenesis protein CcmH/NrfF
VAGLQLTMSTSHALKAIELDLLPRAYAAAAVFWSYPILLILVIGTWRGHRSQRRSERPAEGPAPA